MKHWLTIDGFSSEANALRGVFENRFSNPHSGDGQRFVWDFWYVPDQYRLVRTPAYHYFPQKLYRSFHESLVTWGREVLGCHDVSPPWLSYYVEGCRQNLHADVPHGPWAFVYSLSPRRVRYAGGETLIMKPETLSYWSGFSDLKDREFSSFVDRVPSPFNRLTVFDPRFPHGVTEVRGVENPLEGRLVIHGWFVEPRPYVVGPLKTSQVQRTLDQGLEVLSKALPGWGSLHGTMSFRLAVSTAGKVTDFRWLTDTVVGLEDGARQRRRVAADIRRIFTAFDFPRARAGSQITVPLLFK